MSSLPAKFKTTLKSMCLATEAKHLLACSGGCDSMVLLHLLLDAGIQLEVAHVNYGLRGDESDGDMFLVQKVCWEKKLPFHLFMAKERMMAEKLESVQMAARKLRYEWFDSLLKINDFEGIFTAHHKNDQVETVLLNLARGTGIKGLRGMLAHSGNIIRPLLQFPAKEIRDYAKDNGITFRDDSSNASVKYQRNFTRHEVIPALEKINPAAVEHIAGTASYASAAWELLEQVLAEMKQIYVTGNKISRELQQDRTAAFILYHLLEPYHLQAYTEQVLSAQTSVGAIFESPTHRLLCDRQYWVVEENLENTVAPMYLNPGETAVWGNWKISAERCDFPGEFPDITEAVIINASNINWPIKIRNWETGDSIKPLGMKGRKKLSDIFTEAKISRFEKEKFPVICNGDEVVCVPGLRVSEDYRGKVGEECVVIRYYNFLP